MMLSLQLNADSWEGKVAKALHPSRGKNLKSCTAKLCGSIPCHCNICSVAKGSLQWHQQSVDEFLCINNWCKGIITAFNVQNVSIDNSVMISCY